MMDEIRDPTAMRGIIISNPIFPRFTALEATLTGLTTTGLDVGLGGGGA